jgi:signal transduction histidine kinase
VNRLAAVVFVLSVVLIASVFELLMSFYGHASREVAESWYHNEFVNLQQGNILSAITKLQRGISDTSLLQGAVATDSNGLELARIGKFRIMPRVQPKLENNFAEYSDGLFRNQFQIEVNSVQITLFMESYLLKKMFAGILFYFMALILGGGLLFKRMLVEQEKLKSTIHINSLHEKLVISEAVASMGRQVAHDIRSPLMALETALRASSGSPMENRKLIEQASLRIRTIADDLLLNSKTEKKRSPARSLNSNLDPHPNFEITGIVASIVSEKKLLFPSCLIELSGFESEVVVRGVSADCERILSNLFQNSIEALEGIHEPRIQMAIRKYASQIQLSIIDNGRGIPVEVLSRIGEEGFSFGKPNGNGLGVSFAKRKVQEWGGHLQINSQISLGTMVTLAFVTASEGSSRDETQSKARAVP